MKLRIGLASPSFPFSVQEGVLKVKAFLSDASAQGAEIICFPESFIPGLRGQELNIPLHNQKHLEQALLEICESAEYNNIATIVGMDWETENGLQNVVFVISENGKIQGCQTKNQIPPDEEGIYIAGNNRQIFEVKGVKFGIVICHEGWRYPESVRWAARRGASIVFHPHFAGSDRKGNRRKLWGEAGAPFFEKAMICRSLENNIYFASVNYALRYQETATSLIDPDGNCIAYQPFGQEGLLVSDIDISKANGLLAARFSPELYL